MLLGKEVKKQSKRKNLKRIIRVNYQVGDLDVRGKNNRPSLSEGVRTKTTGVKP